MHRPVRNEIIGTLHCVFLEDGVVAVLKDYSKEMLPFLSLDAYVSGRDDSDGSFTF